MMQLFVRSVPWDGLSRLAQVVVLVAVGAALAVGGGAPLASAQESSVDQLARLALRVDSASAAVAAGDTATARAEYGLFDDGWFDVEDGVRDLSRASYRAIEQAMREVVVALAAEPIDSPTAVAALSDLRRECDAFLTTGAPATGALVMTS